MSVSLVLPCYNPPQQWEQHVLQAFNSFCAAIGERAELVIVFDGAGSAITDTSIAYLRQHVAVLQVLRYEQNRGKGFALRQGVAAASGDIIMYTDVDFPYTIESMRAVYDVLGHNEADVAIGVKNDAYYAHVPAVRRFISRVLRFLIRIFLSMPVTDTQCGLKGFRRPAARVFLATTIDRYLFDLEFVRGCFKAKDFRVKAVKVALNENVRFRKMDYRILLPELANFARLLFK